MLESVQVPLPFLLPERESTPVTEVRTAIGYNKAVALIEVPTLSLSAWKLVDAAWFIASRNTAQEIYDVDLLYFRWLAHLPSRDQSWLLRLCDEAQNTKFKVADEAERDLAKRDGGLVPFLGEAIISNGRFSFSVSPSIRRLLGTVTGRYVFFSLSISNRLTKLAARQLYSRLLPWIVKGGTPWYEPVDLIQWFGGKDQSYVTKDGLKGMNRYWVTPAVQEINRLTDLDVTVEQRKKGPKTTHIRFVVKRGDEPSIAGCTFEESDELFQILRDEFGLSRSSLSKLISGAMAIDAGRLREVVELTRYRIAHSTAPIDNPGGLFMHLLKEGAALTKVERERIAQDDAAQKRKRTVTDAVAKHRSHSAQQVLIASNERIAAFEEMKTDDQDRLVQDFRDSPLAAPALRMLRDRAQIDRVTVVEDRRLRGLFAAFLEMRNGKQ